MDTSASGFIMCPIPLNCQKNELESMIWKDFHKVSHPRDEEEKKKWNV